MEHGFLSTIREWKMFLFLFHIGGWNRVSTPPSLGHSIIEGWKTVSTPPYKEGGGRFSLHYRRLEEHCRIGT
jgi:hypothetical protein